LKTLAAEEVPKIPYFNRCGGKGKTDTRLSVASARQRRHNANAITGPCKQKKASMESRGVRQEYGESGKRNEEKI
jgi:hypothetical protein